jgi:hypothetical protein
LVKIEMAPRKTGEIRVFACAYCETETEYLLADRALVQVKQTKA